MCQSFFCQRHGCFWVWLTGVLISKGRRKRLPNLPESNLLLMITSPTLGRPSAGHLQNSMRSLRARFKASGPHLEQFQIRAINDHIALNFSAAAPAEVRNKVYLCFSGTWLNWFADLIRTSLPGLFLFVITSCTIS